MHAPSLPVHARMRNCAQAERGALVLLASLLATAAHPQAAPTPCLLSLPGSELTSDPGSESCVYLRRVGAQTDNATLMVRLHRAADAAGAADLHARRLGTYRADERDRLRPVAGLGDAGAEAVFDDENFWLRGAYSAALQRACWFASVDLSSTGAIAPCAGGGWQQVELTLPTELARAVTREIDRQLQQLPCATAEPAASLGVSLACQALAAAQRISCTATPQGAELDALVRYRWRLDGRAQTGGSRDFDAYEVAAGRHRVEVVAVDGDRGLESEPQSVELSLDAPAPAGVDAGDSGWLDLPAILAGVLVLGVAGLLVQRLGQRALRAPAAQPDAPPPRAQRDPQREAALAAERVLAGTDADAPAAGRDATPPDAAADSAQGADGAPQRPAAAAAADAIHLLATPSSARLRGDGRASARIDLRAIAHGGRPVPITELRLQVHSEDPALLSVVEQRGVLTLRSLAVGTRSLRVEVRIAGVHPTLPVHGLVVPVEIEPQRALLRLRARKGNFAVAEIEEVLPGPCRRVRAQLLAVPDEALATAAGTRAGAFLSGLSLPATLERLPVADAEVEAYVQLDGREVAGPLAARSDADGRVEFALPGTAIAVGSATHTLTRPLLMTLEAAPRRRLQGVREHAARIADAAALASVAERCRAYPTHFHAECCRRADAEAPALRSALELLHDALLFSNRGRKAYQDQQAAVAERLREEYFASLFDLFTDVVPLAGGFYALAAGTEPVRLTFRGRNWTLPSLASLVAAFERALPRASKPALWLALYVLGVLLAALQRLHGWVVAWRPLCPPEWRLHGATPTPAVVAPPPGVELPAAEVPAVPESAQAQDLAPQLAERLRRMGALAGQILAQGLRAIAGFACELLVGCVHGSSLLLAAALGSNWRASVAGAIGEELEQEFGEKLQKAITSRVAALLDGWLANPQGRPLGRDLATICADVFGTVDQYDTRQARTLVQALEWSLTLAVPEDWQAARARHSEREKTMLRAWQEEIRWQHLGELAGAALKALVKFLQGVYMLLGVGRETLVLAWRRAGWQVHEDETAEHAGAVETAGDLVDLMLVRTPILLQDLTRLQTYFVWAHVGIHELYRRDP